MESSRIYIEHSELTEETLNDRTFHKAKHIEDIVSESIEYEQLHRAVSKLPKVQRRRLKLYFFGEMSYEQIAKLEGCTKRAVKFSVDIAVEKLKKNFKKFQILHYTMPLASEQTGEGGLKLHSPVSILERKRDGSLKIEYSFVKHFLFVNQIDKACAAVRHDLQTSRKR